MARDLLISHGRLGNGARRVLGGEDLQAACYRCHELKPLTGAEKAWEGFQLFQTNACGTCHNVDGLAGGRYGPDLSEIGSSLGLKEIQKAIEDPKAEPENSIMPRFSVSPEQIKDISYFLKSRAKESFYETPMRRWARIREQAQKAAYQVKKMPQAGQEILRGKKCLACHKFEKEDGRIAPDLTYLAYMRSEDYIKNFLYSPGKEIPGAIMPWIPMDQAEEEKVIASLQRKNGGHLHTGSPKHIYMELCQRCHAAQGDGFGTIQPNLANFPRAFWKNGEFFRSIPDGRIVKSIAKGIPGTSMPPYGELLGDEAADSLLNLIFREFIRIKRDDKRADLAAPPRAVDLLSPDKADNEFKKYCASCHGVAGNGKGPEYLKYLPRPRDLTNHPYFGSLTDDRIALAIYYGIAGSGMGAFKERISPQSLWSLIRKIRRLSNTDGRTGESN